jgi:hypothetical protein
MTLVEAVMKGYDISIFGPNSGNQIWIVVHHNKAYAREGILISEFNANSLAIAVATCVKVI